MLAIMICSGTPLECSGVRLRYETAEECRQAADAALKNLRTSTNAVRTECWMEGKRGRS